MNDMKWGHPLRIRTAVLPVLLVLAVSGCGSAPAPSSGPEPSPSSSEPAPSATPAASPAVDELVLPGDCVSLVPTAVIQNEFGPNWVPISYTPHAEDVVGQDFVARGGLVCLWGIPSSGAGVTVYVAERATATDLEQVTEWVSDGLMDCSPFLDACFSKITETEMGTMAEVHVLVEGFEMRVQSSASSIDPLLVFAHEAATNMGYI
ncbi:MAG: hypothetical protein IT190_03905 [Microbacteriaceae bacterium]|nr:hypothetical protein [Microbacteriaceae bacterium]